MSSGADHLARALAATRADDADAHAVRAIHADPDLAVAYALRGRVAALRSDCVGAAHYYRVAYDRGDHSAETRSALAVCVAAAGNPRGADAVRGDAKLPAMLAAFAELVSMQGPMVRGVLQARLPPAGQPAFLPGDPAARLSASPAPTAGSATRARAPRERTVSLGTIEAESAPPAPRQAASYGRGPEPVARQAASYGRGPEPVATVDPQSWLEASHTERRATVETGPASWLDDAYFADVSGGQMAAEPIELAVDPGALEIEALSPITGRRVLAGAPVDTDAWMPKFDAPQTLSAPPPAASRPPRAASRPPRAASRPPRAASLPPRAASMPNSADLLEARAPLVAAGITGLRVALNLPGPVITATGQRPQKLGKRMALGLTASELVLCDPDLDRGPVRLPFSQLNRMDVLRAGQQVSLTLADGRQLHLDLRSLEGRAPTLVRVLVAELGASLRAVGAPVNI